VRDREAGRPARGVLGRLLDTVNFSAESMVTVLAENGTAPPPALIRGKGQCWLESLRSRLPPCLWAQRSRSTSHSNHRRDPHALADLYPQVPLGTSCAGFTTEDTEPAEQGAWINAVRPSRRPLRGWTFLNAINVLPHAEERSQSASRGTHRHRCSSSCSPMRVTDAGR
jgi:hypothetical protein